MTRPILFFAGLVVTVAATVFIGDWLVPDDQLDPAFGLEVVGGEPSEATSANIPEGQALQQTGDGDEHPDASDPAPAPTPTPTAAPSSGQVAGPPDGPALRPTLVWMNVFSQQSELDGGPLPVGATVEAFDPDGALAGRSIVVHEGMYGLMAVYMDDPTTAIDEGAEAGDLLRFEVNGQSAQVVGPDAPVWTDNGGLLQLNLVTLSLS